MSNKPIYYEGVAPIIRLRKEFGLSAIELTEKIIKNLPEGGIALHGCTYEKIESVTAHGLNVDKSATGTIHFVAGDEDSSKNNLDPQYSKARVFDLLKGINIATSFSVQRSLECLKDTRFNFTPSAIAEGNLPSIVIFESNDKVKLNNLGEEQWPGRFHTTRMSTEDIPPEAVKSTVTLTREELVEVWDNSQQEATRIATHIVSMLTTLPYPTEDIDRNNYIRFLGYSADISSRLRTLLDASKGNSSPESVNALTKRIVFELNASHKLTEKVVYKIAELYL